MIFLTWLRRPRVADSATKPIQTVPVKPRLSPLPDLPGPQVTTTLLDHQTAKPPDHVVINLTELVSGVPGPKV
ncbi:MAG TPA: hypothetical protein VHV74_06000, partial [Pseudonocardiaceae bacterium]|nr:hypothetical protein [Pseudonocardiaceae bacterium]